MDASLYVKLDFTSEEVNQLLEMRSIIHDELIRDAIGDLHHYFVAESLIDLQEFNMLVDRLHNFYRRNKDVITFNDTYMRLKDTVAL